MGAMRGRRTCTKIFIVDPRAIKDWLLTTRVSEEPEPEQIDLSEKVEQIIPLDRFPTLLFPFLQL